MQARGDLWAGGIGTPGMMMGTMTPLDERPNQDNDSQRETRTEGDPQLRSCKNVEGYSIKATDGPIGDVEDFIVDDNNWKIDFIVADTGNWLPNKKVLVSPEWIKDIDWATSSVVVIASTDQIKNSLQSDPTVPITEEYQSRLINYMTTHH